MHLRPSSRMLHDQPPLWDSFQDPPSKKASGSDADWKKLQFLLKLFKLFVYLLVFVVILASSVLANLVYLYMAGNTSGSGPRVQVCTKYRESMTSQYWISDLPSRVFLLSFKVLQTGEMIAARNRLDQIAWVWALVFAFAAPELFTFLRALRICMFKRERRPSGLEVGLVSNIQSILKLEILIVQLV